MHYLLYLFCWLLGYCWFIRCAFLPYLGVQTQFTLKKDPEKCKKNPEKQQKIGKITLKDPEFDFRKSLDTLIRTFEAENIQRNKHIQPQSKFKCSCKKYCAIGCCLYFFDFTEIRQCGCKESTFRVISGLIIVILIAISGSANASFARSTYNKDFDAPYFNMWFGNVWMILVFPLSMLQLVFQKTSLSTYIR